MNKRLKLFFCALAQNTRFNFLADDDSDAGTRPAAVPGIWLVAVRGIMGLIYTLLAWLLMALITNRVGGAIITAIAILALHSFITGKRENGLPAKLFTSGSGTADASAVAKQLLALTAIPLMLFLLILWGGAEWLLPIFALGAAAGCELSAPRTAGKSAFLTEVPAWILAAVITLAALILANLAPGLRAGAFAEGGLAILLSVLGVTSLRQLQQRPAGLPVNCFLAETAILVFALLCLIF